MMNPTWQCGSERRFQIPCKGMEGDGTIPAFLAGHHGSSSWPLPSSATRLVIRLNGEAA